MRKLRSTFSLLESKNTPAKLPQLNKIQCRRMQQYLCLEDEDFKKENFSSLQRVQTLMLPEDLFIIL